MSEVRVIEVKRSVFEDNNQDAARLRAQLKEEKTFLLNLMSSPGSGKTTTLLALAKELQGKVKMGVMEADMTILSVPEGHDKPLKYPLMYETCDLLVINKIDVMEYFDFDKEKVVEYAKMRNPKIDIIFISAKTGEGIPEVADWILAQTKEWIE